MSEFKWTPGPWVVSGDNGRILSHWDGIGYWEIANAAPTGFEGYSGKTYSAGGDREANARLIASAPKLFDILDQIAKSGQIDSVMQHFADEALKEAKGTAQ